MARPIAQPDADTSHLPNRIAELRFQRGWSQQELAEKTPGAPRRRTRSAAWSAARPG